MSVAEAPALRLFGVPTWTAAPAEVVFAAARPFQLLAVLACRRGWTAREEIAELLWPERSQRLARGNLRTLLLRAQKLAPGIVIEQQGDRLRWQPDTDLQRFERAIESRSFTDALALYRGPLMQGMEAGLSGAAAEWLGFERERVAARWRAAAAAQLRALSGAPEEAAALAEALLQLDALDETALDALARSRAALGDPASALRALDAHALRLRHQLGLEPSAALRALARELGRQAQPASQPRSLAAPAAAADAARAPRGDGFVGRRIELAQLREWLLHEACRVVTITGPGGVGKSSLARAALQALAPAFSECAWWLPLDDLSDAEQLPARLAALLAIELKGHVSPWRQIESFVGTRPCLLVLDNSEHLPALAPALATLLAACPRLHLLNTSRSRLSLKGEWLLPLDGLPLPDADETDPGVLRHNDAVRLFEARAQAASPVFDLAAQAGDVVRLLHAVEGMPLAIELAAAWVRVLPAREILAELSVSLDVLEVRGQPVPTRERSLRASFEHSWRMLSPIERTSLVELAQLPAAFDREMALQVARSPLPVLAALVDKSLLGADVQGRFSLHALLRLCAAEKAAECATDVAALRSRHAAYVAHWLAGFQSSLQKSSPRQMLTDVARELQHVRSAWQWSVEQRDPEIVVHGALPLMVFFEKHGLWGEGMALFEAVAATYGDSGPAARGTAMACRALATLQTRSGQLAQAEASARRAYRLALRQGDRRSIMGCLNTIGLALFQRGRATESRTFFEQALRYARKFGEDTGIRIFGGNVAMVDDALGRYDVALASYREVLAQSRRAGDVTSMIADLHHIGGAERGRRDWAAALAAYEEALSLCDEHRVLTMRATKLAYIGAVYHAMGELRRASDWLDRALADTRATGDRAVEASVLLMQAALAVDTETPAAAATRLRGALVIACDLGSLHLQVQCAVVHGEVLAAAGATRLAATWLAWGLGRPECAAVERDMARWRLAGRGFPQAMLADHALGVPADGSLAGAVAALERETAAGNDGAAAPLAD